MKLEFVQLPDYFDQNYTTLNLTDTIAFNVTHEREFENLDNIASLLFPFMEVTPRATGPFSYDLTSRDDVLLALISLFSLFVLESIITTILLRRHHGLVSNFGFSVKQVIELVKDLNICRIFFIRRFKHYHFGNKPAPQQPQLSKLNVRLLILAFSLFFVTFGLEVAILFLTNIHQRPVKNSTATFRIRQPVTPEYLNVLLQARVSINRPCEAISIERVHQADTKINGCVDTDIDFSDIELFSPEDGRGDVELSIQSRLHDYGADHTIQIGSSNATYKQRTLFTLGDGRSRVMATNGLSPHEKEQMRIIYHQYVAYLFSLFNRAVPKAHANMTLQRLNNLEFEFEGPVEGDEVDVLQLPGRELFVPTRQYAMRVQGELPRGTAALRIAQHFFRGMAAVVVVEGNKTDLFMDSGVGSSEAVVWEEDVRVMNWLSLAIIAGLGVIGLGLMRWFLKPASTAEIARVSVKKKMEEVGMVESMESGDRGGRIGYVLGAEVEEDENEGDNEDYVSISA